MGFFAPGFQRQLAFGVGAHSFIVGGVLAVARQRCQRIQHLVMQFFAFEQHPFLKGLAMFKRQAVQKLTLIQRSGCLHTGDAIGASGDIDIGMCIRMQGAFGQQFFKMHYINGYSFTLELNRLRRGLQEVVR